MSFTQRLVYVSVLATGLCGSAAASLSAQQPVTREQAAAAALARGARAAFGRADTASAGGGVKGVQRENVGGADSVAAVQAPLSVQLAMGLPAEDVTIVLADSLAPPSDSMPPPRGEPLPVAAAAATLRSSERALALAHRSVFAAPSLQVGFDHREPGGERGLPPARCV